ncbi:hypothetical protein GW590_22250 [Rahnella sp. SAP-1]|jgi:hypothetical protein|uniref:Shiga toxin A subunit n=1 Tax=Rouxiella aceris TaxID=2703884 RepID=A0A848MP52_9GAMM|nr:hypothetical protein [Rouxiella aceris]NMP29575.1 hypothetical protein [Rouxiella aceris]
MKNFIAMFLIGISSNAFGSMVNPCVVIGSTVDINLIQAMKQDFGIHEDDILKTKTKLEIIDNQPVTKLLAAQMAKKVVDQFNYVDYDGMRNAFMEYNARNLIVKYTYINKQGKENIFVGSSIVDDEECSVNFNGYITVKREF